MTRTSLRQPPQGAPTYPCGVCHGEGVIETGRTGRNDPDTITLRCPGCFGECFVTPQSEFQAIALMADNAPEWVCGVRA